MKAVYRLLFGILDRLFNRRCLTFGIRYGGSGEPGA